MQHVYITYNIVRYEVRISSDFISYIDASVFPNLKICKFHRRNCIFWAQIQNSPGGHVYMTAGGILAQFNTTPINAIRCYFSVRAWYFARTRTFLHEQDCRNWWLRLLEQLIRVWMLTAIMTLFEYWSMDTYSGNWTTDAECVYLNELI